MFRVVLEEGFCCTDLWNTEALDLQSCMSANEPQTPFVLHQQLCHGSHQWLTCYSHGHWLFYIGAGFTGQCVRQWATNSHCLVPAVVSQQSLVNLQQSWELTVFHRRWIYSPVCPPVSHKLPLSCISRCDTAVISGWRVRVMSTECFTRALDLQSSMSASE